MEHVHTRIDAPITLRKHVLEAALLATETGKFKETMQRFADNKKIFRNQLKVLLKQIQTDLETIGKSVPALPPELMGQPMEREHFEQYMSNEERWEEDLDYIRKRLQALHLSAEKHTRKTARM